MATKVPIRCGITISLIVDIDITEGKALETKLSQIIQDLKTIYPDKIISNRIHIDTQFASKEWSV